VPGMRKHFVADGYLVGTGNGGQRRVADRHVPRRTRRPVPRTSTAWSLYAALPRLIEFSRSSGGAPDAGPVGTREETRTPRQIAT
jgi:hypothetical protein